VKLVVLGPRETLATLPEYGTIKQMDGFDPGARCLDYSPSTKLLVVGEENVMGDAREALTGDCLVIREMAKAFFLITGTRPVDPNWNNRGRDVQQYELRVKRLDVQFGEKVQELYTNALSAGHWKGTAAVHDDMAYWAAGVLAYFDAAGQDAAPLDAPHPISTRELLQAYDPALFALVKETMAYEGHVDWRYTQTPR
jgi:hypothetical protein